MKVIVFNRKTRMYLQGLGRWSNDPREAYFFQTAESAVGFCHYHGINGVLVVKVDPVGHHVLEKVSKLKHRRSRTPVRPMKPPP